MKAKNKKFLEIGVGLGADHQKFVEAGAESYGIDLTERSVEITKMRLNKFSLKSKITVGDAENLNFENNFLILYILGE